MKKVKILISGEEYLLNIINSVEELPAPCNSCQNIDFYGFGIDRITCRSRVHCEYNEKLEKGNYAMFPQKISEIFRAAWSKTIKYPRWFFRILFTDGKPAWRVAFEVEGAPYCYILKGTGKGTCRKLTQWEIKNQKILECSYDEAERWSRYFEAKTKVGGAK
jgi:hypothetical protein